MSTELGQIKPLALWCLHGNLQTPVVWDPLKLYLQQQRCTVQVHTENLWETLAESCEDWAVQFCQRVQHRGDAQRVLLGYSLGGRLGFHAVLHRPDLWAGAVIVAADPGTADGRAAQLDRDRAWADRFLAEPLAQVMADWNRLPLFGGRPGPDCDISPFRQAISVAFVHYSKGRQADLRAQLEALQSPPLLYISGSNDAKYTALGRHLACHSPNIHHSVISRAAHRVPWDNPLDFNLRILTFVNKISERYS